MKRVIVETTFEADDTSKALEYIRYIIKDKENNCFTMAKIELRELNDKERKAKYIIRNLTAKEVNRLVECKSINVLNFI